MQITRQLKTPVIHKNLSPETLKQQTLDMGIGELNDTGALVIKTGKFTGRSPKDKFFVREEDSAGHIDWNDYNFPIEEKYFLRLRDDLISYLSNKEEVWVRTAYAGADEDYRISLTCVNEFPDGNLFAYNMFIRPEGDPDFDADWIIIQAPDFLADPEVHGTRQGNFAIISLAHKTILIGGTGYTGEIKKGIFTIMNYLLPVEDNVLTMHCSANVGVKGDVAVFFGLSGTGKTTLSTDPNRGLIGDDEHGWTDHGVFNIEGGCYAKVIDLSEEKEPQIFKAIRGTALVENTVFLEGTNQIDYGSKEITENTRVSYPIDYIEGAVEPSVGGIPKNIFFLTCDAFGVLPPLSLLTTEQAMFYFLSGYTAKIAGTEEGIKEPRPTFSTCFGAPFLPLSPNKYAQMLGEKIKEHDVKVWMVNTGWTGGGYGVGSRIKLSYTRAMINAILDDKLKEVITQKHPVFGLKIPLSCPGVPSILLNPINTWGDKSAYQQEAKRLAGLFTKNFEKFSDEVSEDVKKVMAEN